MKVVRSSKAKVNDKDRSTLSKYYDNGGKAGTVFNMYYGVFAIGHEFADYCVVVAARSIVSAKRQLELEYGKEIDKVYDEFNVPKVLVVKQSRECKPKLRQINLATKRVKQWE